MGQYYDVCFVQDGKVTVLNKKVDGGQGFTGAKLMEHSWWKNDFLSSVCSMIYKKPAKITWVGDYADDSPFPDAMELYKTVWGEDRPSVSIPYAEMLLDGKYLANHTKKVYMNCDKYVKKSVDRSGWIIHPLPLLTAVGNGNGGGDYHGTDMESVGSWHNNLISVEDTIPEGYEEEIHFFREK